MSETPTLVFRPGTVPTHDDPEGGKRWHYLTADRAKLDPPAYIYEHVAGGYGGECGNYIFPDGYSPAGPATREHIETRIEAQLQELGIRIAVPSDAPIEA
jgi:hypothetical protein